MNAPRSDDTDRDRDPLAAYADGDPEIVRAAAPREPTDTQWEAARRQIHRRLASPCEPIARRRGIRFWVAAGAALTATAAAAAVAWMAFPLSTPKNLPAPMPDMVRVKTAPALPVAPLPHEGQPDSTDPLAEFAVLPMATAEDVVLHRVPGDGWLPVGMDPLPDCLSLASPDEVELTDSNQAWPRVTPSPGDAPMIFAAKPR